MPIIMKNKGHLKDSDFCPVKGKHEDTKMENVPNDYLIWLSEQPWLGNKYPQVAKYIKENWWSIKD